MLGAESGEGAGRRLAGGFRTRFGVVFEVVFAVLFAVVGLWRQLRGRVIHRVAAALARRCPYARRWMLGHV